ncbi:MAG: aldehyde ferredoxin oxidoreductase N-terminal domain-containing protein, partial [Desulfatiglandales bacterium]
MDVTSIGYAGKILRVNLSDGKIWEEELDEAVIRKWVGGVGLGAKYLYDEVPPGVEWSDPENRLIWTTGPLAGTDVAGAATINIMGKGPMTNLGGASQANGFIGAYLKFSGFDGIIFEGKSPKLVYLQIREGGAELKDAGHLAGKDVMELEDALREELGVKEHDVSVFGIGPAGENKVRFACVSGDRGHVAGHNGLGAVMGAKNIKAVVVFQGKRTFGVFDPDLLKKRAKELAEFAKSFGTVYEWGTGGGLSTLYSLGALPIKNYTTNIYPEHERMNGQYLRNNFDIKSRPCYRCSVAHVKEVTVTEGPYTGFVG